MVGAFCVMNMLILGYYAVAISPDIRYNKGNF